MAPVDLGSAPTSLDPLLDIFDNNLDRFDGGSTTFAGGMLDNYINRMKRMLRRLYTIHNSTIPVNKLPLGILKIFQTLQTDSVRLFIFPPVIEESPEGSKHQWLRITQVCSYWRSLAIQSPSLWCYMVDGQRCPDPRPRAFRLFLERSSPRHIHVLHYSPPSIRKWSAHSPDLAQHPTRVKSPHLSCSLTRHFSETNVLSLSLPTLQNLFINPRDTADEASCLYLPQLFYSQVPMVRRLALTDAWCWPTNSAAFANVTHLVLSLSTDLLTSDFLGVLKHCPLLRIFHFNGNVLSEPGREYTPSSCPYLKVLRWEYSPFKERWQGFHFEPLAFVVLPAETVIYIQLPPTAPFHASDRDDPYNKVITNVIKKSPRSVNHLDIRITSTNEFTIHSGHISIEATSGSCAPFLLDVAHTITEICFTQADGHTMVTKVMRNLGRRWLSGFRSLLTIPRSPTNYLQLLDAIFALSAPICLQEVHVKKMGTHLLELDRRQQARLLASSKREQRLSVAPNWGGQYCLFVEGYDPGDASKPNNLESFVESLYCSISL